MAVTYFKRYRMEMRLDGDRPWPIETPRGFEFLPWSSKLLLRHAEVKWESFRDEIDAHVFPCLGQRDGCQRLMREIAGRQDFIPRATWLACQTDGGEIVRVCGTIQGLQSSTREGAIQNLGVHPDFRDHGLGSALLGRALRGFQEVGCRFAHLEVTVQNGAAIRLYERFGFRRVETLFKVSDVPFHMIEK